MNYNPAEAIAHWQTAPHAAEAVGVGRLASLRADIPRGQSGMVCCGWVWEDREEANAHRYGVHA